MLKFETMTLSSILKFSQRRHIANRQLLRKSRNTELQLSTMATKQQLKNPRPKKSVNAQLGPQLPNEKVGSRRKPK